MREAGLSVREDAVGNLIGRREGAGRAARSCSARTSTRCSTPGATTGRSACWPRSRVAERLARPRRCRSRSRWSASPTRRGCATARLPRLARDGGPLRARLAGARRRRRRHAGRRDARLRRRPGRGRPPRRARPSELLAYCELHIEQGPVLERRGVPVGVVTAIAGQTPRRGALHAARPGTRGRCRWTAAATRWPRRRSGSLAVEALVRSGRRGWSRRSAGSRVEPGAHNVIPGEARLSLDVRHGSDAVRREARRGAARRGRPDRRRARRARALARARRGARRARRPPELRDRLADGRRGGRRCRSSGCPAAPATTASRWRAIAPVAMLFVRCEGGISHNPAESGRGGGRRGGARRARALRACDLGAGRRPRRPRRHRGAARRQARPPPTWRSRTAGSPRSGRSCRTRRGDDRRRRPARPPGRDRRARALQRAGPHRLGGLGHRHARARRGRRDRLRGDAAQRPPADGRRRRLRRQGGRRRAPPRWSTSRSGAGSCRATSTASTSWPRAASSASRPSCATAASTTSRRSTTTRSAPAWGARRRSGCPVAVHAERPAGLTRARGRRLARVRGLAPRRRRSSRPIERALELARGDRLLAARRARQHRRRRRAAWPRRAPRGVDATCETCPHYLVADRGGHGAPRDRGQVRAAAAPRGGARRAVGRSSPPGAHRLRRLRPLPRPARAQGGRLRRRRGAGSRAARPRSRCCSTQGRLPPAVDRPPLDLGQRRRALPPAQGAPRAGRRRRPRARRPRRARTLAPRGPPRPPPR